MGKSGAPGNFGKWRSSRRKTGYPRAGKDAASIYRTEKDGRLEDPQHTYESLLAMESLEDLADDGALERIGVLIDLSSDLRRLEGLKHAVRLSEELQRREGLAPGLRATSDYFLANAWSGMRVVSGGASSLDLEQPHLEKEVLYLRRALANEEGVEELPAQRLCQILTNLGNVMSAVGRIVEAVEYWERALKTVTRFPMALANRGHGLTYYSSILYDEGHQGVFLKHAHGDLSEALSPKCRKYLEGNAAGTFESVKAEIEAYLRPEYLEEELDLSGFSLGESQEEVGYREWCLENRLFLNPLNDLGAYPIAARDVFSQPSITTGLGEGPYYLGLYNQMKQEYASARYLYYEGTHLQGPHFSDRGVRLYNTLDYPSYSLSTEKAKAAFRTAYSLFDKTAFFLNHYLGLSIPEHRVTFRTFWYEEQKKSKGLKPVLKESQNWPLRGLFWLGKDLYEDAPGFREAMEPEARELAEVRNHLEHKYLKLHEDMWRGPVAEPDWVTRAMTDTLAFSVYRYDFEEKALRLLKMARAALIYLSLAIHQEERRRAENRDPEEFVPQMESDTWDDEWKL